MLRQVTIAFSFQNGTGEADDKLPDHTNWVFTHENISGVVLQHAHRLSAR